MYVSETIGREAQAKASRISAKDADRTLKALLEKDKEGTRALIKARQASGLNDFSKDTNSSSSKRKADPLPSDSEEEGGSSQPHLPSKNAYSADVIRKLGFDPTSKGGRKNKHEVAELQRKVIDRFNLFPLFAFTWYGGFVWCADCSFSVFPTVGSIDGLPFLKAHRARPQTRNEPFLRYYPRPKTRRKWYTGFQARTITQQRIRITPRR